MRIVGGEARGRRLFPPKDPLVRPSSDRVREALFNLLGPVSGFLVLDLFAGTGALGLEALSRGAERALFIDKSGEAEALIRRNAEALHFEERIVLWRMDAEGGLKRAAREGFRFDLAMIDPPYRDADAFRVLDYGLWTPLLKDGARVVLETAANRRPDLQGEAWRIFDRRRYGDTELHLLELIDNKTGDSGNG